MQEFTEEKSIGSEEKQKLALFYKIYLHNTYYASS